MLTNCDSGLAEVVRVDENVTIGGALIFIISW